MCAAVDIIGKKVDEVLSLPPSPHWWKVQHAPVDSDMECPLLGHPRGEHSTLAHIPAFPNCGWHPPLMERCSAPAASWQEEEEEEAVKEVNEARLSCLLGVHPNHTWAVRPASSEQTAWQARRSTVASGWESNILISAPFSATPS